jgi:predicted oxidoreductase (fatty acid repression mutant protein)
MMTKILNSIHLRQSRYEINRKYMDKDKELQQKTETAIEDRETAMTSKPHAR